MPTWQPLLYPSRTRAVCYGCQWRRPAHARFPQFTLRAGFAESRKRQGQAGIFCKFCRPIGIRFVFSSRAPGAVNFTICGRRGPILSRKKITLNDLRRQGRARGTAIPSCMPADASLISVLTICRVYVVTIAQSGQLYLAIKAPNTTASTCLLWLLGSRSGLPLDACRC